MNVKVENAGPCKKLIKVELPYEEMKDDINKVKQTIQRNAAIPGFRHGKAPWHLIEQAYGDTIETETKHQVINSVYSKILEEQNLHPVRPPAVMNIEYVKDKSMTFDIDVEIKPEFELPEYAGINIEKKKINVTDQNIEEELKYLQEARGQFEVISDRPAKMGDFIIVDYEIMQKKDVLDQAKQVWIEMKEGFFIPKFCIQLVGMKKDEEREIKVILPKEYPKPDLADKKVIIHVKVNEIKKKVLPEINDEFAKEVANLSSLSDLKDKIKEQLEVYIQNLAQKNMVGQVENYLLENTKIEVPPSIVGNYEDTLYESTVSWLKNSGKADDNYIKEKDAEIRNGTKKEAEDQVKLVYIYEAIAQKENIDVAELEMEDRIEELAKRNKKSSQEIKDTLNKEDKWWSFKYNIRNEKIINFLIDKAKVKEVEAKA